MKFLSFAVFLALLAEPTHLFAQGAAVIMPLSKHVTSADEVISFFIHNRLDTDLKLKYSPRCDVDGTEQSDEDCLKVFSVTFDIPVKSQEIVIPKGGRLRGDVHLTKKELKFALFKPLFVPVLDAPKENSAVRFDLSYQPGYLFVVNPVKERISKLDFDSYVLANARRARLKLDLTSLSMPQVVSVSAKLLDAKSKKTLRFVRLASDKIVDPKRKVLELESDFAGPEDKTEVCYQAFVESQTTKEIYNSSNCN